VTLLPKQPMLACKTELLCPHHMPLRASQDAVLLMHDGCICCALKVVRSVTDMLCC
jgi:hypothetical protein